MDANDSETLRAAVGTLRQQEAKGRGKYGSDLDGANLTAAQLLTHAAEEAADLLMYLTALQAHATLDQQIAGDWELAYRGACRELAARVARVAELEASMSSNTAHRQTLSHEITEMQHWREASLKTIARKDRRIEELEAEVERLKAEAARLAPYAVVFDALPQTCARGKCQWVTHEGGVGSTCSICGDVSLPDFDEPAPAPTTRPLTTADRPDVEVGDVLLRYGKTRMTVIAKRGCLAWPAFYRATDEERGEEVWCTNDPRFVYLSRADGGPVTVEVQP